MGLRPCLFCLFRGNGGPEIGKTCLYNTCPLPYVPPQEIISFHKMLYPVPKNYFLSQEIIVSYLILIREGFKNKKIVEFFTDKCLTPPTQPTSAKKIIRKNDAWHQTNPVWYRSPLRIVRWPLQRATLQTRIQAREGPSTQNWNNKFVLKWVLGKIQCFKPVFSVCLLIL